MPDRRLVGLVLAMLLLAVLAVMAVRVATGPDEPRRRTTSIGEAVEQDADGFRRAERGTPIRFPEDHGPHPDYQLEWWYLTANLRAEDGRRFGVQFTIFRNALAPPDSVPGDRPDDWSTRQLYLAHAAVTDIRSGRFMASERLSRGAAGLAFARSEPLEIRVEDWFMRQTGTATFPLAVRADAGSFGFDLQASPVKPVVLQGDGGFSPKGPSAGQASIYYSYTRLETKGSIRIGDDSFRVDGFSWLDREWSTSFLGSDQVGWDWFSIQLEDGRDLMAFQLRNSDPATEPFKDGLVVAKDGSTLRLAPDDFTLEPGRIWSSPESGAHYPVEWRLRVPREGLDLRVTALHDAQELNVSVDYWEGAVDVDSAPGAAGVGTGYLEMTGYAGGKAMPGMDR